jgi:hypothetical protein
MHGVQREGKKKHNMKVTNAWCSKEKENLNMKHDGKEYMMFDEIKTHTHTHKT